MIANSCPIVPPLVLLADAGLPMIAVTLPLMVCALIPVILIEVWVAKPKLKTSFGSSARAIAVANVVSTIVGVPIAWIVMLGVEVLEDKLADRFPTHAHHAISRMADVMFGSAWIGPPENSHDWIVPVAAMILLVPTFFASWHIEALIVERMIEPTWPVVRKTMFKANLASYALLFVGGCAWLVFDIAHRR